MYVDISLYVPAYSFVCTYQGMLNLPRYALRRVPCVICLYIASDASHMSHTPTNKALHMSGRETERVTDEQRERERERASERASERERE